MSYFLWTSIGMQYYRCLLVWESHLVSLLLLLLLIFNVFIVLFEKFKHLSISPDTMNSYNSIKFKCYFKLYLEKMVLVLFCVCFKRISSKVETYLSNSKKLILTDNVLKILWPLWILILVLNKTWVDTKWRYDCNLALRYMHLTQILTFFQRKRILLEEVKHWFILLLSSSTCRNKVDWSLGGWSDVFCEL